MSTTLGYTFDTWLDVPLEAARVRVEAALKVEGFGILTEIDVAATLRAKLGVETKPYLILGACNPALAYQALEIDPSTGALLPCNVVLRQAPGGDQTLIEFLEPRTFLAIAGAAGLAAVAGEASQRLHRVAAALAASAEA
ncbi:MAG: DUF302 domain-containing protein [Chloroflexota bacterium]